MLTGVKNRRVRGGGREACGGVRMLASLHLEGATRAVPLIPAVSSFLEPQYPVGVFVRALLIAVGVGLAGALYPAYRAVRLSPMGALRYE